VNLSVFLITIAYRSMRRAVPDNDFFDQLGTFEAIAFAWFAIEALLNELAYFEVHELQLRSQIVYEAVERGGRGFERVQAVLTYLYGTGLEDGTHPANDLKHLAKLRNGLVHYKFRDPRVVSTLKDLQQRGYFVEPAQGWDQTPLAWPSQVKPELGQWAYNTACDAALAIADLMPHDHDHASEAGLIRNNFEKRAMDAPMA